jgi:SAM-dependent methyltransferase
MLDQVQPFVDAHTAANQQRPLQVLDVGGGKGNLAAALAKRFGPLAVQVRVVDVMAAAVAAGRSRAAQQGVTNLAFTLGDASQWTAGAAWEAEAEGGAEAGGFGRVDLVVALHACGALSDVALAQAVRHRAAFLVCPCCYLAHQGLKVPTAAAFATSRPGRAIACQPCATTSAVRDGAAATHAAAGAAAVAAVAPSDWLGVAPARHLSLLRAAELQGDGATAAAAMHAVAALRAEAALRHWRTGWAATGEGTGEGGEAKTGLAVTIKQFPLAYSTRNLCIVGVPE